MRNKKGSIGLKFGIITGLGIIFSIALGGISNLFYLMIGLGVLFYLITSGKGSEILSSVFNFISQNKLISVIIILISIMLIFGGSVVSSTIDNFTGTIEDRQFMSDTDSRIVNIEGIVALYGIDSSESTINLYEIDAESEVPNLMSFLGTLATVKSGQMTIETRRVGTSDWESYEDSCNIDVSGLDSDRNDYAQELRTFRCSGLRMRTGEYYVRLSGSADIKQSITDIFRGGEKEITTNEEYLLIE